jgi:acid phosphatase
MTSPERTGATRLACGVGVGLLLVLAAACGGDMPTSSAARSGDGSDRCPPLTTAGTTPSTPGGRSTGSPVRRQVTKLIVVVLENHNSCAADRGLPHLAALAARYAKAEQYYAVAHPSLPNYLTIAGGSTFSIRDDRSPAAHPLDGQSVFGQVIAAGKVAKTYAEGMQRNCQQDQGKHDPYAVRHNPWTYFTAPAERQACQHYDVPAGTPAVGTLHDDLAAGNLPTFSLLVPDLCNDAHDCPLGTADTWLTAWLDAITAGPDFTTGHLAVVVTFDEDDKHAHNRVLTVVLHPRLHGVVVQARLDHTALNRAASELAAATPLRDAANAPDLLAAFGLGH